jgi:hypothetical protein
MFAMVHKDPSYSKVRGKPILGQAIGLGLNCHIEVLLYINLTL